MSKKKDTAGNARTDWLDATTDTPLIGQYAERLGTFLEAMADGRIDDRGAEGPGGPRRRPHEGRRAQARRRSPRAGDPPALRAVGLQYHAHAAPVDGSDAQDEVPGLRVLSGTT